MNQAITVAPVTLESLLARVNEMAAQMAQMQEEIRRKDEQIDQLNAENLQLRHQLTQLKKMVFGAKSERFLPALPPEQLTLGFAPETVPAATASISYTRKAPAQKVKHPGRLPLPGHLPRHKVVLEPEGVDVKSWKKIGEEITEELDYTPGRLFVRQYVRPKYVNPQAVEPQIVCAALPERPISKGIASPALLAYILMSKYVMHLPVYRQIQQFKREGVAIPASTINEWIAACTRLLEPLYRLLAQKVLSAKYLQVDETTNPVLDKNKKGKVHKGFQWVYHSPQERLVLFDYRKSRNGEGAHELLKNFTGYLQSDGYTVYDEFADRKDITLLNCMAYARRKFVEAQKNDAARADHVLTQMGLLYALERRAGEEGLSEQAFIELREKESAPVLAGLKEWMVEHYGQVLPQSPIGKAIAYALPRWEKLSCYLEQPYLNIDNNWVENAIRPLALGRKNYLFSGSHQGAERSAMLYSLLGSCKLNQVNPQEWLSDVLERIASHPVNKLEELLPGKWAPNLNQ